MNCDKYEFDAEVFCGKDLCGRLTQVTLERTSGQLTHLVVAPSWNAEPRLVPADWAQPAHDGIRLGCSLPEFDALQPAFVAYAVPSEPASGLGPDTASDIDEERRWRRHDEVSSFPLFGLGPNVPNPTIGAPAPTPAPAPHVEYEDQVPPSEVRIRGDHHLHAADGEVGRVAGVEVDAGEGRITHVLLDEGHLWGRKRVAVPVSVVRSIDDEGVTVRLSKRQIKDLPSMADDL